MKRIDLAYTAAPFHNQARPKLTHYTVTAVLIFSTMDGWDSVEEGDTNVNSWAEVQAILATEGELATGWKYEVRNNFLRTYPVRIHPKADWE